MLSEGRYGVEIITQISAVNTALEAVAVNVLNDHDNHCVAGGLACGDEGWRPRRAASCSTPCTASPTPAENVTARPLAATVLSKLGDALSFSFGMFWEILWALILGFGISAMVQAVISKGCGSRGGTSCRDRDEPVGVAGFVDSVLFLGEVVAPVGVEVAVAA
jgi:Metal-sensitive transcriptional repressor